MPTLRAMFDGRRLVAMLFGAALIAIAVLAAGGIGGEETAEPPALRLGDPGMPLEEHATPARELPAGFVPNLPAVPTLPPGAHASRAHAAGAGDDAVGDDLSAEMRLLSEARVELGDDDATACLALLDQHRERFPAGALAEERDAYTILALHELHRDPEVERRYVDFRADYPDSSFRDRLARALARP
jgi:hypothetical protein